MAQIFISYRRDDASYVAGILCERLRKVFGQLSVFMDLDTIPLGKDFREYINNAVEECDVLLALIGDEWLTASNDQNKRRIDDPADYVRIEIEAAINRNIPVIPILIDNAVMPSSDLLPETLRPFAFRNAAELRAGRDMDHHMEILMCALQEYVRQTTPTGMSGTAGGGGRQPISHAKEAMATFRFVRDNGWAGMLRAFTLQVDGRVVGKLRVGETFDVSVAPGMHQVQVSGGGTFFDWEREISIGADQVRLWKVAYTMAGGVKMTEM